MVSAPETFGLVYLEAMAKGCIVIGTKNWGIDGIVWIRRMDFWLWKKYQNSLFFIRKFHFQSLL